MGALAGALGDRWTDDVEEAWRLAYNLTAEVMMGGFGGPPAARARPVGQCRGQLAAAADTELGVHALEVVVDGRTDRYSWSAMSLLDSPEPRRVAMSRSAG